MSAAIEQPLARVLAAENIALPTFLARCGANAADFSIGCFRSYDVDSILKHSDSPEIPLIVVLCGMEADHVNLIAELLHLGCDSVVCLDDPHAAQLFNATLRFLTRVYRCAEEIRKSGLTGRSPAMWGIRKMLARAALDKNTSVILEGDTGTGKCEAAKAMHLADPEKTEQPFSIVDCASLVDSLFGSEIYGHVKGAFTGAVADRKGAMASAAAGTLVLDELGELPLALQAGLLTAIQERQYKRVGSDMSNEIRCRFVGVTNRKLVAEIEQGKFREDLYHRLAVHRIELPPLAQRTEDIGELFLQFVREAREDANVDVSKPVIEHLSSLTMPGNVRELRAIARRAALTAEGSPIVQLTHLPARNGPLRSPRLPEHGESDIVKLVQAGRSMKQVVSLSKAQATEAALSLAKDQLPTASRTQLAQRAGQILGVHWRTVYDRDKPA